MFYLSACINIGQHCNIALEKIIKGPPEQINMLTDCQQLSQILILINLYSIVVKRPRPSEERSPISEYNFCCLFWDY